MDDYYLVDAKQEYTTYLISILTPSIYNGFRDIYEQSKKLKNENSVFKNFQILLNNVPNWNNHLLEKEVKDIIKETNCDWLDNLITAVFVSHSKILTSVKVGNYKPRSKKIDLKIPDTTNFIHQCYLESARVFYRNPMVFLDDPKKITTEDYLKNYQYCINTIKESILNTVRKLLPFKNILNEYLSLENNTLAIGGSLNNKLLEGSTQYAIPDGLFSTVGGLNQSLIQPPPPIDLSRTLNDTLKVNNENTLQQNTNFNEQNDSNCEVEIKGKELVLDFEEPKKKRTPSIPKKVQKKVSKSLSPKFRKTKITLEEDKEQTEVITNKIIERPKAIQPIQPIQPIDEIEITQNQDNNTSVLHKQMELTNKKINIDDSINSKTIDKIVSNIRNEIEQSQIFKNTIIEKTQPDLITEENKSFDMEKIDELFNDPRTKPLKNEEENQSINIEKINELFKENGTIISEPKETIIKKPLNNKLDIKKTEDMKSSLNSQKEVKKISIKYANTTKKPKKKEKTTLIDSADDTDSSEFILK